MFDKFFYTLKEKGLKVTLTEWLTLQDALNKDLCHSSLTEFYYVAMKNRIIKDVRIILHLFILLKSKI